MAVKKIRRGETGLRPADEESDDPRTGRSRPGVQPGCLQSQLKSSQELFYLDFSLFIGGTQRRELGDEGDVGKSLWLKKLRTSGR